MEPFVCRRLLLLALLLSLAAAAAAFITKLARRHVTDLSSKLGLQSGGQQRAVCRAPRLQKANCYLGHHWLACRLAGWLAGSLQQAHCNGI